MTGNETIEKIIEYIKEKYDADTKVEYLPEIDDTIVTVFPPDTLTPKEKVKLEKEICGDIIDKFNTFDVTVYVR